MKFVVTGASGFVGKKVVFELLAAGHSVTVLGRSARKLDALFGNAVRVGTCDLVAGPPDGELFRGADAVVHLAGEGIADRRWNAARKKSLWASRVEGTRNLVETLRALGDAGPRVLVAASAIGYFGDRGNDKLTETSSAGAGFLADLCREWEREANRFTGQRTVLLRIGVVLGPDGGALGKMLPLFRAGLGGVLGDGSQYMSWIHQDDLAALVLETATNPGYAGAVNAVAPEPVTNREFTRTLARVLRRPSWLPAPAPGLRLAMGEMASFLLASTRVLPAVATKAGFPFRYPTLEAALRDAAADGAQVLDTFQLIPKPIEDIFPFFADEMNLEKITPPWLHFHVLGKSTPELQEGSLIDYRLRVRGVPVRWQSRISSWSPGKAFVDEQVRGPYRRWHHTHQFVPVPGGTLMRDRVLFEVPRVPLVRGLVGQLVRKDVERIFAFRRERIAEMFR